MPLYPFETQLVFDANNPSIILANASITFYSPDDTAMINPLSLVDPGGIPMGNPVVATPQGFVPAFKADIPQVVWFGGGYAGYMNSYQGVLDEAKAAKAAAEAAVVSATGGIPQGGADGQVLAKAGSTNFSAQWIDLPAGGGTVAPADVDDIVGDLVNSGTGAAVGGMDLRYRRVGMVPHSDLPAGATLVVRKSGSTWPARPTSRNDITVIWVGADPDPAVVNSGTGGALNNVDIRMAL